MQADPIAKSFELAAERHPDPAPLIYARLFARFPEMESLFSRDTDGSIRGHMLFMAIENLLEFAGNRGYAANLIEAERINHENLGVPNEVFPAFFEAIRDTVRELISADWTDDMNEAWVDLLGNLRSAP